jgi:4-hydroxybutyryl-CoA dehydratase/vinylacetyl-CoA-Delta-isomerase
MEMGKVKHMTGEEYIESLKKLRPEVWMRGEKVERVWENPYFRPGINSVKATYDAYFDPELRNLVRVRSSFVGEEVSMYVHVPESMEDLFKRAKLTRIMSSRYMCVMRCLTSDVLRAFLMASYEIDRAKGTNYHERVREYVKYVQENDLTVAVAMTDVKGDRSLRPKDQPDKDMYLRIVEERKDGIVVRGAKANITGVTYAHEVAVLPTRVIGTDEREYAVAFAIPVDTKGIKYIARPTDIPREERKIEAPARSRSGHVEHLVIFDDVFVPMERVFMKGEAEFTSTLVLGFASEHRHTKCACKAGQYDIAIGAAALMADMNGLLGASHIREKIIDIILAAEIGYACCLAAAVRGRKHPSGVFQPDYLTVNVGKYLASHAEGECIRILHDIGGGPIVTMPTEADIKNPEVGPYILKYFQGRKGVPAEHRIRTLKLLEDLVASAYGGWLAGLSINAAGSPMAERIEVWRNYDLREAMKLARRWAGIPEEK